MRIAILEDDPAQLRFIEQSLTSNGHTVVGFTSGKEMLHQMWRDSFDMLVLDWQVPDATGMEVLQKIRERVDVRVPVIFTTLRSSEEDIVQALAAGADDYMIKPLRRGELIARVNALLRRVYPQQTANQITELEGYRFDAQRQSVDFHGQQLIMTQKEFELALLLFKNLGRPLARKHILESVWGRDSDIPSRTLDTHVSRVRTKLNLKPEAGFRLAPVYSYGYRLERLTEFEMGS